MYNETGIKKTMLISPEQDSRLKTYCKMNRISASQLFRLMIDELTVTQYSTLKDSIQTTALTLNNFVSPNKNVLKETINDGKGNIISRWFSNPRRELYNSFPKSNHE